MSAYDELLAEVKADIATIEDRMARRQAEQDADEEAVRRKRIALEEIDRVVALLRLSETPTPSDATNYERIESIFHRRRTQMTDVEVLDALTEAGWETDSTDPLGLVRTYLSRLVQQGKLRRISPRVYAASDVRVVDLMAALEASVRDGREAAVARGRQRAAALNRAKREARGDGPGEPGPPPGSPTEEREEVLTDDGHRGDRHRPSIAEG